MILNILLLLVGFLLLIKGADFFIDGAASTAQSFKVPKMLIGLTIMAFGTSAPEFAISMSALANHSTDMVLGNVIGSNILNVLLIIGVGALLCPIKIKDNTIKKELPITLLISTLLVVLMLDNKLNNAVANQITRSDAIVILLFFIIFVYYLVSLVHNQKEQKKYEKPKYNIWISLLLIIVGLGGIILGSNMVVNNASSIAKSVGISERIIAITIIALGTSLPELVTTIVSSAKNEQELLVGNIVGSNIFNICVVLGIPVAIFGNLTPSSIHSVDIIALLFSSFILFIFSISKKTISRFEGVLFLLLFVIYYYLVFII